MSVATNGDVDLYYEHDAGDGPDEGISTVVFVNDVGYGAWLWGWQHGALAGPRGTVVWDLRGTGRSDAPSGPYDVDTLAADLEAVLADAGVTDALVVGAGLGGMIAIEYARRYERATALAVFGTAGGGDRVNADALESLFAPRDDAEALGASLQRAFGTDLDAHPEVRDRIVGWRREEDADRPGWDAQAAAMAGYAGEDRYEVTLPTRVFHGTDDAVVPPAAGRDLTEELPRGEFTAVEGGHLCFVEESAAVNDALVGLLEGSSAER